MKFITYIYNLIVNLFQTKKIVTYLSKGEDKEKSSCKKRYVKRCMCKICVARRLASYKYNHSEKGRIRRIRYENSEKAKIVRAKYKLRKSGK